MSRLLFRDPQEVLGVLASCSKLTDNVTLQVQLTVHVSVDRWMHNSACDAPLATLGHSATCAADSVEKIDTAKFKGRFLTHQECTKI